MMHSGAKNQKPSKKTPWDPRFFESATANPDIGVFTPTTHSSPLLPRSCYGIP